MKQLPIIILTCLFMTITSVWAMDDNRIHAHVINLEEAPVLDGIASEWLARRELWTEVLTTEASFIDDDSEKDDPTGWDPQPLMAVGIYQGTLYITIRWRDESPDMIYRPWKLRGGKYTRSRRKDDMLSVRFHTGGDFDACMLAEKDYTTDLWRWSAGRSQTAAMADDMTHWFSTVPMEHSVEYKTETGVVYFRSLMDEGEAGWGHTARPDEAASEVVSGVMNSGEPEGSRGDVRAFGRWQDGFWTLELSRKLTTDDPLDAQFTLGQPILGQLAIFNSGYRMRKQVTPILEFDFHHQHKERNK